MCKLLFAINHQSGSNPDFTKLVKAQFDEIKDQPDGIGAVVLTQNGELFTYRELKDYDAVYEAVSEQLPTAKFVGLHTRISTGGTTALENIHFFESDGYLLAHNGWIAKYAPLTTQSTLGFSNNYNKFDYDYMDYKPQKEKSAIKFNDEVVECKGCLATQHLTGYCKKHRKEMANVKSDAKKLQLASEPIPCDSLAFLQALPKPLTTEILRYQVENSKMSGMMVVIERATKKVWLVINKKVLTITDKKTYDAYFSFDPSLESEKELWLTRNGVPFLDKKESVKIKATPKQVGYGTYELTY